MSDAAWLVVAVVAGVVFVALWIARELWMVRRRRRGRPPGDGGR